MFSTSFPIISRLFRVHPKTLHLLFNGLPHVSEECTVNRGCITRVMVRYAHMMRVIKVLSSGMVLLMSSSLIHHMVIRCHLRWMLKQDGISRCWLWRCKIMVLPS